MFPFYKCNYDACMTNLQFKGQMGHKFLRKGFIFYVGMRNYRHCVKKYRIQQFEHLYFY